KELRMVGGPTVSSALALFFRYFRLSLRGGITERQCLLFPNRNAVLDAREDLLSNAGDIFYLINIFERAVLAAIVNDCFGSSFSNIRKSSKVFLIDSVEVENCTFLALAFLFTGKRPDAKSWASFYQAKSQGKDGNPTDHCFFEVLRHCSSPPS